MRHYLIILTTSLNVTTIESVINNDKPIKFILIYVSLLKAFFLIASIIRSTIFPPSNAGTGKRFVIPSETDITDNK